MGRLSESRAPLVMIVGLVVLPLAAALMTYFLNVNVLVGIAGMMLVSVGAVGVLRSGGSPPASDKWAVESAFEVSAVIGIVASITAAIPIFDAAAVERQRQGIVERAAMFSNAATRCEGAAPTACCHGPVLGVVMAFHREASMGTVEADRPEAWRAFRETLQAESQACAANDAAMRDLVRSVNAYTKTISDHASYGAVRSSLSWLNDVKASVLFTICLIFYLCQAIALKLIKAVWLGRPY